MKFNLGHTQRGLRLLGLMYHVEILYGCVDLWFSQFNMMYEPRPIGFYENRFLSKKERNNQQHAASYQKQVALG